MPRPDEDLGRLASEALRVRHWMTRSVLHADPEESIGEVRLWMDARGFQVVPLRERPVGRFLRRGDLDTAEGRVTEHASPIAMPHLVEADLPLRSALPRLARHGWFFVIEGDEVVGIVTRSDLRRPAIRLHTLAYLLVLEEGLDTLLRSYGGYRAVDRRSFHHAVTDTLACTPLLADLGLARTDASRVLHGLRHLRNHLAHGRSLLDHASELPDAVAVAARAAEICDQVWALIEDRDQIWEAYAQAHLVAPQGNLPDEGIVITAYNPHDDLLPAEENQRRDQALHAILTLRGLSPIRTLASDGRGGFEEPGYAVSGLALDQALQLARRFDQRAIYRITADGIQVVDSSGRVRRLVVES